MARGAKVTGSVRVEILEFDTAIGPAGATATLAQVFDKVLNMASGTGDGQVDRAWFVASGSISTTPASYDLSGSLASLLNGANTVVGAELQLLIIENTGTSGDLLYGGGSTPVGITNGTTDGIVIPPGGWHVLHFGTAGLAIGAATTDLLRYVASTGTVTFKLWAAMRSA